MEEVGRRLYLNLDDQLHLIADSTISWGIKGTRYKVCEYHFVKSSHALGTDSSDDFMPSDDIHSLA